MSTTSVHPSALKPEEQLHSGDRMLRREFHRLYEKTPDGFKAELVGGTVYVASPLKRLLAKDYGRLMAALQQGLATPEHADFVRHLAGAALNKNQAATP